MPQIHKSDKEVFQGIDYNYRWGDPLENQHRQTRKAALCAVCAALLLTACGGGSDAPAEKVAKAFLSACKKGKQQAMLDYSTIGLTDGLHSAASAQQRLDALSVLRTYSIKSCEESKDILGEYRTLLSDTETFRAASGSADYGRGAPLFESLDDVYTVQYTGRMTGSANDVTNTFYVICKDGEWAADIDCLSVMRQRLYQAEIDRCNEAANILAQACSKALSEMETEGSEIALMDGTHTFTSGALSSAQPVNYAAATNEELYQTMLAKTYAAHPELCDMEQMSVTVRDGWVSVAAVQNDVYRSESGAADFIGFGGWPRALTYVNDIAPNQGSMTIDTARAVAASAG